MGRKFLTWQISPLFPVPDTFLSSFSLFLLTSSSCDVWIFFLFFVCLFSFGRGLGRVGDNTKITLSSLFFSKEMSRRKWICCLWLFWVWESCWQKALPSTQSWVSSCFSSEVGNMRVPGNAGGKLKDWPVGFTSFYNPTRSDVSSVVPVSGG